MMPTHRLVASCSRLVSAEQKWSCREIVTVSPTSRQVFVEVCPVTSGDENSSRTSVWKSKLESVNALTTRLNSGSSSEQLLEFA